MFDWARESGLAEHFLLNPMYCPIDGQYGAMYLVVDEDSTVWAMCDECERLWNPTGPLDQTDSWDQFDEDDYLEYQRHVDRCRLARREDLERAGLTESQVIRLTTPVREG